MLRCIDFFLFSALFYPFFKISILNSSTLSILRVYQCHFVESDAKTREEDKIMIIIGVLIKSFLFNEEAVRELVYTYLIPEFLKLFIFSLKCKENILVIILLSICL